MPLTVERRIRPLSTNERERISRLADVLREESLSMIPPRLSFSSFAFAFAFIFVLFSFFWFLTLLASEAPVWFITSFWLVMTPLVAVWSWVTDFWGDLKSFRNSQRNQKNDLDRMMDILSREMLTIVHLRAGDLEGEEAIPSPLLPKFPYFQARVGDDLVFVELENYADTWIVNSEGGYLASVPD